MLCNRMIYSCGERLNLCDDKGSKFLLCGDFKRSHCALSGQIRTADTLNLRGVKMISTKTSIRTLGLSTGSLKRHLLDVMSITVYFEAMKMTWVGIMSWTIPPCS